MPQAAFVGREREMALAEEKLNDALSGRGGLLVFTGVTGSGKSRALDAALEFAAKRGALATRTTNFDHARSPFGPFADALREIQKSVTETAPTVSAERAIYNRVTGISIDEAPSSQFDRRRAFVIVREALERAAARRPIVVGIDDMQWADPESLELLAYLAPLLPTLRLGFAIAVLEEPDSIDGLECIASFARFTATRTIELQPISDASARAFIASAHHASVPLSARVAEEIVKNAGGNPLVLAELLSEYERSGNTLALPRGLQHVVKKRLGTLAEADRRLTETASLFARPFTLDELANLSGIRRSDLLRSVRALRDGGVLVECGASTFSFAHEFLRVTAYRAMLLEERAELHRTLAQQLMGDDAPEQYAELARHLAEAGDRVGAASYALRAGDFALERSAPASARDAFLFALELTGSDAIGTAALQARLGGAYDTLGDARNASVHFAAAAEFEIETTASAGYRLRLADTLYRCGEVSEAIAICERLLHDARTSRRQAFSARVLLATYHAHRADIERARENLVAAEACVERNEAIDEVRLAWASAMTAVFARDAAWFEHAHRALELARAGTSPSILSHTLINFASIAWERGQHASAAPALREAIDLSDRHGLTLAASYARCVQLETSYSQGRLQEAFRLLLEVAMTHVDAPIVRMIAACGGLYVVTDLERHDAVPWLADENLLEAAFATGEAGRLAPLAAAHVYRRALRGDLDGARQLVQRALALCASADYIANALFTFARFGTGEQARSAYRLFKHESGALSETYRSAVEAICARHDGNSNAASRAFRATVAAAENADLLFVKAYAFEGLGDSRAARDLYDSIGAVAHVQRLSAKKGVTLTRREREIAELLRRGLSNRAIATELVISERTVENHLASVFAKVGVHSRAEFISSAPSVSGRDP